MYKFYNKDCMLDMVNFKDNEFDLAIVDPPYGNNDAINVRYVDETKFKGKRKKYREFENMPPASKYFKELKRVSKNQIIWGVNWYNNFDLSGGRLCWDKKGTVFGRAELAYLSMTKSINICEIVWNGMIQEDMKNKEYRIHPTQKPVALYRWLLQNYAKPNDTILDTHVGSGSSIIACLEEGFDITGYEIDKDYYDAACKRIEIYKSQIKIPFGG